MTARHVPTPPRTHLSEPLMAAPLSLPIDRNSPVPLYHQLALALEGAIRSGALAPDTRLDNEIELAARLHVGRVTVRSALARLADAGLVIRTRRVGTYVTSPHQWVRPHAPATV
ncbi:UNVERIFIED_CONTAM: GntR family transcriptional regulator [Kocuria sp. CPCC 205316]|uniref:GntR family transcriptional regulator n=1 Tax=Kocuria TaxID=57493 RepID=UPI0036D7C8DD